MDNTCSAHRPSAIITELFGSRTQRKFPWGGKNRSDEFPESIIRRQLRRDGWRVATFSSLWSQRALLKLPLFELAETSVTCFFKMPNLCLHVKDIYFSLGTPSMMTLRVLVRIT